MGSQIMDAVQRKFVRHSHPHFLVWKCGLCWIFHNYKLSEKSQPYAGVDVSWVEKDKSLRWELWTMMVMGMLFSQYTTTKMFAWGVKVIIGD